MLKLKTQKCAFSEKRRSQINCWLGAKSGRHLHFRGNYTLKIYTKKSSKIKKNLLNNKKNCNLLKLKQRSIFTLKIMPKIIMHKLPLIFETHKFQFLRTFSFILTKEYIFLTIDYIYPIFYF